MKECGCCLKIKPLSDFGPQKATKDGLQCYCRECARSIARNRYYRKADKIKQQVREWQKNNKKSKNKKQELSLDIRKRLRKFLFKQRGRDKFSPRYGCSANELKQHLENQFIDDMTWENYKNVWCLDHIKPLSLFDLTNLEERDKANHYTNLRPIKKEQNNNRNKPRLNWNEELKNKAISDEIDRNPLPWLETRPHRCS